MTIGEYNLHLYAWRRVGEVPAFLGMPCGGGSDQDIQALFTAFKTCGKPMGVVREYFLVSFEGGGVFKKYIRMCDGCLRKNGLIW